MMRIGPWLNPQRQEPELARVIRGVLQYRQAFIRQYRWVPFPLKRHLRGFGASARPLPAGALLRLWDRLPELCGPCSRCGGTVHAYTDGRHWRSVNGLWGVCLQCCGWAYRGVTEPGAVEGLIAPTLADTEFRVAEQFDEKAWQGCEKALPAVLAELGYPTSDREVHREPA